jgi:lysophospholipase L1-like esterase
MGKKDFSRKQKLLFTSIILLVFFSGIIGCGELYMRVSFEPPTPHFDKGEIHPYLGWVPLPNMDVPMELIDGGGNPYHAHYRTTRDGFREYGNPKSNRKKVFFIGDSFTQSVEVSNEMTYYRILADSLDFELFAYGHAGYGNLQEWMVLDQFVEEIQPDLVVLQVCDNDFIDNHLSLELQAGYHIGVRRPYLSTSGDVYYARPIPVPEKWLHPSRFLTLLYDRMKTVIPALQHDNDIQAETRIREEGRSYPAFEESIQITKMIIDRFKERTQGKAEFIAFSASAFPVQAEAHRQLFSELDVPFTDRPGFLIEEKAEEGTVVFAEDNWHWNEAGHFFVAQELQALIQRVLFEE